MEKKRFGCISQFLIGMAIVVMLGMLVRLYDGYLKHGEKTGSTEAEIGERETIFKTVDEQKRIRVCLRTSDYSGIVHENIEIESNAAYEISYLSALEEQSAEEKSENRSQTYDSDEVFQINKTDMKAGDVIRICSTEDAALESMDHRFKIRSITRAQGTPSYTGILYLCRSESGILLLDELPLEAYLPSVVSSEMPSAYPEEAQKAQAVCARTYAVNCMKNRKYEGDFEQILEQCQADDWQKPWYLWDLDDSVEFQVYNNQEAAPASAEAVKATEGEILDLPEVLYYSTSAGSEHRTDLNEETAFAAFLAEEPEAEEEYGSPRLRWQAELSEESILSSLAEKYKEDLKKITNLEVMERSEQGQVQKLKVVGETGNLVIEGEYQIRKILAPETVPVYLRDGTVVEGMSMLPSAYFVIENSTAQTKMENLQTDQDMIRAEQENAGSDSTDTTISEEEAVGDATFVISGGGYGHGIGMSQYGAAAMAQSGCDYREILEYYYAATVF